MALLEFQLGIPATILILATTCFAFIIAKYSQTLRYVAKRIPGPRTFPVIGSAAEFYGLDNDGMVSFATSLIRRFGLRYFLGVGPVCYVGVHSPEDVEWIDICSIFLLHKVLSSSVYIAKGDVYKLFGPWLGEGLLTSNGQKWQHRRKLLTPSFHFKILEDFLKVFNEQSQVLVHTLRKDFGNSEEGNIFPYITRCALDIICETAMGVTLNAQTDRETPYVKAVYDMCGRLQYRFFRPWFLIDFLWNMTSRGKEERVDIRTIHQFANLVIQERKRERRQSRGIKDDLPKGGDEDVYFKGRKRLAFLDMLLEAQENPDNKLSDSDIREEVDTFMFEGHDTTAASIGWTTFLLASHTEHQDKVRAELEEIFGGDKDRTITSEDLTKMKYLDICIKESLRLYPSVPILARELHSDLQLEPEVKVPKGANVFIMPYCVHRNPKVWPQPERFDPSRFTPENATGRHPYAYIPFSAGPRNCIGQKFASMEEKVVLANIFRNFRVIPAVKMEEIPVMLEIITRPRDGFPVKLVPLSAGS